MLLYLYIDFYDRKTNPRQDDTGESRRQTQTATAHEVRLSMTNNLTGSDQSAENTTRTGESDERTENTGDSTSNRRRFLLGVGAATALVAGCVSGGDDDGDTGSDGSENGGDTGSDNDGDTGSDNGGDTGSDNGGDGDNGTDSSDNGSDDSGDPYGGDDGDDGDPYGGSNGDDSGSNGDGDDGGSDDGGSEDGGSDDGGSDDDSGDSPSAEFFDTFQWSSEFRMVTTAEEAGGTAELVFNDGDRYLTFEGSEGQSSEMYFIDDTVYVVAEGECIAYDSAPFQVPEEPTDIQQEEDLQEQNPDITEVGTDTIDGDPVTVYEVDAEMLYTMYVLESGYPRRVEVDGQSVDYYDWGDTDPIEPPDMDCSSPGGGGGGGGDYP